MIENIKIILHLSRLYGCHLHTINKGRTRTSKLLLAYSYLLTFIYCLAALYLLFTGKCVTDNSSSFDGCTLLQVRRILSILRLALCSFTAALRYEKYDRAQISVKRFDKITGSAKQEKIHPVLPWILIIWVHLYHISIKAYGKTIIPQMVYHVVAMQIVSRTGWYIEIVKFYFLFNGLYRRFQRLNHLCKSGEIRISMNSRKYIKHLTIPDVYRLREYLTDSTRCLNAYYDVQLFSWLAVLIVDILDTIVLGINLSLHNRVLHIAFMIGIYISITHSFIQLVTIVYACHRVSDEANKLGTILFASTSPVCTRSRSYMEITEMGFYLKKAPLKITILNIIDVQLDLIITIVGNIVTYLSVFKS